MRFVTQSIVLDSDPRINEIRCSLTIFLASSATHILFPRSGTVCEITTPCRASLKVVRGTLSDFRSGRDVFRSHSPPLPFSSSLFYFRLDHCSLWRSTSPPTLRHPDSQHERSSSSKRTQRIGRSCRRRSQLSRTRRYNYRLTVF
jgi:hypothetical protein